MANRPILASSCARATTAAESRFRIDILPRTSWRMSCVIGLDTKAAAVIHDVSGMTWAGARFFALAPGVHDDLLLETIDGQRIRLADGLDGGDLAVMVASDGSGATAAARIGRACTERGIMTAGVVLDGHARPDEVVSALRPYARVLMVTHDEQDVAAVLTALRA